MDWEVKGLAIKLDFLPGFSPEEILYDFDGPQIFTVQTPMGLMLAYLCDEDSQIDRFILSPTSQNIINDLKSGIVSVRVALDQPWAWVVDINKANNTVHAIIAINGLQEIPTSLLPASNIMLYAELQPLLRIRMIGEGLKRGSIPSSIIRYAIDGAYTAIKRIKEYIDGLESVVGRPDSALRQLYDLPALYFSYNSFEISFGMPQEKQLPIPMEPLPSIRSNFEEIGKKLTAALSWAMASDARDIDLGLLKSLEGIIPPSTGVIERIEVGGQLVSGDVPTTSFILNRETSKRVRSEINKMRLQQERPISINGIIRELDKDKMQFALRDTSQGRDKTCYFGIDNYEKVMEYFSEEDIRVIVLGTENILRNTIDVSVIDKFIPPNPNTPPGIA